MIKSLNDLETYNLSYDFAMEIFWFSRSFPKEEKYSLTDQIVSASRSITANIAESWGKRIYENEFRKHLIYVMGSLEETKVWLRFSKDCLYLAEEKYDAIVKSCDVLGGKIYRLHENWKQF